MITCPICRRENHHLAVTCAGCGGFLQQRVETLDLFATLGRLIESPRRTFHTIGVARHKNYTTLLSMAIGWPLIFAVFWIAKAGEHAPSFLHLLLAGLATGPLAGLVSFLFVACVMAICTRLLRRRVSFRNAFALLAYGFMPHLFVLVFLLPVVFLSFGLYFFTGNPAPQMLRPFSFYAIAALYVGFTLWTVILLLVGMREMSGAGWRISAIAVLLPMVLYAGTLYEVSRLVHP